MFRRNPPPQTDPLKLPDELLWLLDAPLFIDEKQVEAFYDAVVRPDYEGTSVTLSDSISTEATFGTMTTVGAALPWFVKAEVELKSEGSRKAEHGRDVTLTPIANTYRHLLALALHYASQSENNRVIIAHPEQLRIESGTARPINDTWLNAKNVQGLPRALVFLSMPAGSRFLPAALELTNGEVKVIEDIGYEDPPKYPGSGASEREKNRHFQWFHDRFSDRASLDAVEDSVSEGIRIEWIDYNVRLDYMTEPDEDRPHFMHLHLVGRGAYETGVYAYNFIVRGFNHGLRIVGTLKSGPDLNVLAVFER